MWAVGGGGGKGMEEEGGEGIVVQSIILSHTTHQDSNDLPGNFLGHIYPISSVVLGSALPANTQRRNNVVTTSLQRRYIAATL